ncbi:MAG: PQQ-binding-like beta-propeller repeat protein, partial [Planctomycetota bacterium]|nr:PQQ-binding-like beta-propeller repeat protein [Planctomycetota bacterium]
VVARQGQSEEPARPVVRAPVQEAKESPKGSDKAPLGSPEFYPSAERPVGWRADSSGRFPAATPPLEWYRRPKGPFNEIRVLAGKPKGNGPEGEPLNMGAVRDWLVAGPFDAKEHASALDDVTVPNETALAAAEGASLEGKPWKALKVSVANQTQSWSRLTLDMAGEYGLKERQEWQNHPGSMPAQVAYACTNLYSPAAQKVRIRLIGTKMKGWLNGNEIKVPGQWDASPILDLTPGWNRLVLKLASSKNNWNGHVLIVPPPDLAYETKNIAWMTPMPGSSWSSPIVVGDRVFVGADIATLVCVNKADGRVRWMRSMSYYHAIAEEERKKVPDLAPKAQQLDALTDELVADLNAAVGPDGMKADGNKALHEKIKKKIDLERGIRDAMGKADKQYNYWENDRSTTTPTPVSDGKYVYVSYMGGNKGIGAHIVACYDLDGKQIWMHFTGQTGIAEHGAHATPALSGNVLVFASGRTLTGYDKATGKELWKNSKVDLGCAGASPVAIKVDGADAVYVPETGIYRSADGEQLWNSDLRNSIVTPALVDGTFYGIASINNQLHYYAMTVGSGGKPSVLVKKPWKEIGLEMPGTFTNSIIGSPLYDNGLYYVASEGGALTVVDAKAGKPVYTKALESLCPRLTWVFVVGICTGPTMAGKHIHIRDDQGQTLVIEPGPQYKELAKNVLWELRNDGNQNEPQSNPWYEGGRMYYRTQGFLYCIGEK